MIGPTLRKPLPAPTASYLAAVQSGIVSVVGFLAQVAAGKGEWKKRSDRHFQVVVKALHASYARHELCPYCEASLGDQVEHICPKDLYPDYCFDYDNYLVACGACNRRKSNWAIVDQGGQVVKTKGTRAAPISAALTGTWLFLDPFSTNPMSSMVLDLKKTFLFFPLGQAGTAQAQAAALSIEILGLNSRRAVVARRKQAYVIYLSLAQQYVSPATPAALKRQIFGAFRRRSHPTVWAEMKRQAPQVPQLQPLFAQYPSLYTL